MTRRALALLVLITLAGTGCADHALAPPAEAPPEATRILFIGNSLTSVNDLPAMVEGISRAAKDDPPLETESVTFGGYSLEDHLAEGSAGRAIERGGWDVVVLQQGPSTLPESRENLIQYARIFAQKIRAESGHPALYGVWPEEARLSFFDAGIESYRAAADSVDGLSLPAALAWKTAWATDPAFPLYGRDRFHPSPLGTYLAALVVYAGVTGRSPVGLPGTFEVNGGTLTIPPEQALLAQQAAAAVTATKLEGRQSPKR